MSNTYKINFKDLRQENLKDIFASFERALQALDIDFYLIGALARDTWFAQKNIKALGTKDIDFAVLVSDETKYKSLKEFLIKNEGFIDSSSNEYVLFDKKGFQIDLLPFGAIEIEGNKFTDSKGVVRTDISGFKEVYDEAVEDVNFENKFTFKVSSLPGIVILKLIAFDDRPEMRSKDIQDIGIILNHYFELESETIYNKHSDLFEEDSDLMQIGARALGREMQPILDRNSLLKERLVSILKNNLQLSSQSPIGIILRNVLNTSPPSIEIAINLLNQIIIGIHDNNPQDEILKEEMYFENISKGNFELTSKSPNYPKLPHSIFSDNFNRIKLSGESSYQFIIYFSKAGAINSVTVTPNPITSEIDFLYEIPLKGCQIKFELSNLTNHLTKKGCKLSFELLP